MKKRYDDGGYIPKSIFNKEGTDIADVGDAKVMTEPSEEVSAPIKKAIPKSVSNPKEEKPRTTESGMSRGTRPKDPREMEAGMSRGARRDFGKEESIKTDAMRNASRENFKQSLKSYADFAEDIAASKKKPEKKMASGGSASSRADGIATKGKTRGKIC